MSVSPDTVAATTRLLASLAAGGTLAPLAKAKLPGEDTEEKRALEKEIFALANRIRLLELKAAAVNPKLFPETPNDGPPPVLASSESNNVVATATTNSVNEGILSNASLPPNGNAQPIDIEPDLEVLKKHIKAQEGEIQSHGKNVEVLVEEINQHQHALQNVNQEYSRVEMLEKELRKSQRANLAFQKALREIGEIVTAVARGDLTKKVTVHDVEMDKEIEIFKGTINNMTDQLQTFASEVSRVAREVGTEGRLGGQASVNGVEGTWRELTDNVNVMASNLTSQVREIAEVTSAVANGDLSRKIHVEAQGEILMLQQTINTMVEQLGRFALEVTRVSREVGIEGRLGGQAEIEGVKGTWRELTDNVNAMAANLTEQVRNIATVTTAVAKGDLSRKVSASCRGEILQLKETINKMVDRLQNFASEVTKVAREVGTEGQLGGQANVPATS